MRPISLPLAALMAWLAAPLAAQSFGAAVAVGDGDVFITEPTNNATPGYVYIYRRGPTGTWTQHARLEASDATLGDRFGAALSVDGATAVVGADGTEPATGVVYVFTGNASHEWRESGRLTAGDVATDDGFGHGVALSGDVALVSAAGQHDRTGAVYVFRRFGGRWTQRAKLVGSDSQSGDAFGQSVAIDGSVIAVGVPQRGENRGAVYVFRRTPSSDVWAEEAKLTVDGLAPNSRFGTAVAVNGNRLLVGAPGSTFFTGAVYAFAFDPDSGRWGEGVGLLPFDGRRLTQFGATISMNGNEVLVGAPGAVEFEGRVYVMQSDSAGNWESARKLSGIDVESRDRLGGTMAVRGGVAVAGMVGDDYGAGSAVIYERGQSGWKAATKVWSEIAGLDPVLGGQVDCHEGTASLWDCREVDLVSFLPVQAIGGKRGVEVNDLWGWTDPATAKEYALVGRLDGTSFIDVSDPLNPRYLGDLPKTATSPGSVWRDIKVYKNHAFIVADGARAHGMQVFDLTQLRNVKNPPVTFTETAHYDRIHSAHNIVINEQSGYAFAVGASSGGETCGGGLHMINIQDPTRPTFAGCFADPSTGRRKTGYSHDAQCVTYAGPDVEHQGQEICFGANETALSIADVTVKEHPVALAMASYPNVAYTHQGWLTEDQRYFLMDDELDELSGNVPSTRTLIWDVADLDDPVLLTEYFSENHATDHNLYIRGHYAYLSNYVSGLRVLDISDVEHPREVGFFDTVPWGEDVPGFDGSWSNYPFFASGIIVVTSGKEGVFILKKKETVLIP